MWYQSNPIHTEKSHRFHQFTQIFLSQKINLCKLVKSVGLCILREGGYDLFLETFLDFFAFA